MKKFFVAAALGLGLLFTSAQQVQAQTPPAQTTTKEKAPAKALPPRDEKGHFTKAEAKPAATAEPAKERPRDEKGRFIKAEPAKGNAEHPRDAKGRFVKKDKAAAPKSK